MYNDDLFISLYFFCNLLYLFLVLFFEPNHFAPNFFQWCKYSSSLPSPLTQTPFISFQPNPVPLHIPVTKQGIPQSTLSVPAYIPVSVCVDKLCHIFLLVN